MMPGSFQGTRTKGVVSVGADGEEHRDGVLVVDGAVLHVDADPVEAGVRDDFGGVGAGDGEPRAVGDLAARPLLLWSMLMRTQRRLDRAGR